MRLTVDASIAVKWFVAEPLVDEARAVLTRRVQRHAPELLLAECVNTIGKPPVCRNNVIRVDSRRQPRLQVRTSRCDLRRAPLDWPKPGH